MNTALSVKLGEWNQGRPRDPMIQAQFDDIKKKCRRTARVDISIRSLNIEENNRVESVTKKRAI